MILRQTMIDPARRILRPASVIWSSRCPLCRAMAGHTRDEHRQAARRSLLADTILPTGGPTDG